MNYNNANYKKNSINFSQRKTNTISSLHEVEHFLHQLQKTLKCINIYKILK